jgi:hypothetical protein
MKQQINEIEINGMKYVPKDSVKENNKLADELNGMPYCMVRSEKAGVFMGYIKSRNGSEVELLKARRIWYWTGAASLSQLSEEGTSNPKQCKFPCEVEKVILLSVIEIDMITEKAKTILNSVPIWRQ